MRNLKSIVTHASIGWCCSMYVRCWQPSLRYCGWLTDYVSSNRYCSINHLNRNCIVLNSWYWSDHHFQFWPDWEFVDYIRYISSTFTLKMFAFNNDFSFIHSFFYLLALTEKPDAKKRTAIKIQMIQSSI